MPSDLRILERSFDLLVEDVVWEFEKDSEGLDCNVEDFDEELVVFDLESLEWPGGFSACFSSMRFQ